MAVKDQPQFQRLDFDSQLFEFPVVKIIPELLSSADLESVLKKLKKEKVRLAYWLSQDISAVSRQVVEALGGLLVDEKVTYVIALDRANHEKLKEVRAQIQEISAVDKPLSFLATQELNALAILIGAKSRFGKDPRMPRDLMEKMYCSWIHNSVNHTLARHVLVVKEYEHILGMITLGEKNKRGDIGLLSVTKQAQGQGLSKRLVYAAQAEFLKDGYLESQVVTQKDNPIACRVYESCGYHLERTEYFYHFWLND